MRRLLLFLILTLCAVPVFASISEPGGCSASGTTCTPNNFQTGDIAVAFAAHTGATTIPSLPAGWTSVTTATVATNAIGYRLACKVIQPGAWVTATFTNATYLTTVIYRGAGINGTRSCGAVGTPVKNSATSSAPSTTIAYGGVTLTNDGGSSTSWVAGSVVIDGTSTSSLNAPSGMTQQQVTSSGTAPGAATQDTNGAVSSWSTTNVTGGTAIAYASATYEINAAKSLTACSSNCPTLIDAGDQGSNDTTDTPATNMETIYVSLANPSLGGNLISCGYTYHGTTQTVTITDSASNSLTVGKTGNDGTYSLAEAYELNAPSGLTYIKFVFSAAASDFFASCQQYKNIATSSAVDGTPTLNTALGGPGPILGTAITPSQANDLFLTYVFPTGGFCCNAWNWFQPGAGWNLLPLDNIMNVASEQAVYGGTSAVTPTMYISNGGTNFNMVSIAFKNASAGTAAPTPWIACVEKESNSTSPAVDQVPCPVTGIDEQVTMNNSSFGGVNSTAITDALGNSLTMVCGSGGSGCGSGGNTAFPRGFYENSAGSDIPSSDANYLTVTKSASQTVTVVIYSMVGIEAFDTTASGGTSSGTQIAQGGATCTNTANSNSAVTGVPTTNRHGFAIVQEEDGAGPECATSTSGASFDSWWYSGQDDGDTLAYSSSGYGHNPYTSNSSMTYTWNWANTQGASTYYDLMMFFKAPAASSTGVPQIFVIMP